VRALDEDDYQVIADHLVDQKVLTRAADEDADPEGYEDPD